MNNSQTKKTMKSMVVPIAAFGLVLCSCSPSEKTTTDASSIIGEWSILKADGVSTKEGANPATISFDSEGKINGCASVNRFFGSYKFDGKKLTLDQIGLTRMMGPNMEIEDAVIKAINSVNSAKINSNKATLFDDEGVEIMKLKRVEK